MKILLPVDGSEYSALAAEFIASRTSLLGRKPEIEVLNAQFLNGSVVTGALLSEVWGEKTLEELYRVRAEKAFAAVRTPLQVKGIPFREMTVRKAPAEAVLEETAAWKPDLIVMGTQGKTNAEKLFLGSVSTAVLAGTSVPVLLVRDAPAPKKDDLKVGIAVDGSPYGEIAVRYLERYRELLGANPEIRVLNVVEDAMNAMITASSDCDMAVVTEEEARKLEEKTFEENTRPVVESLRDKGFANVTPVKLVGSAGDRISSYANRERLDLVVMGSRGYTNFRAAILGSVTTRVAAETAAPVLIIR